MGDKYKSPSMDWQSPGDVYKRFLEFKQTCNLVFDAPLKDKPEEYKVRMLLLWVGSKGLEVYNTAAWTNDGDNLKLKPVWEKLEAHVKPLSNQIIARFHLRSLRQGDKQLEEFVTQARMLVEDGGYTGQDKEDALRDALVFRYQQYQSTTRRIRRGKPANLPASIQFCKDARKRGSSNETS